MKSIPILYTALFALVATSYAPAQDPNPGVRVHMERFTSGEGAWLGVTLSSEITTAEEDGDLTEERTQGAVVETVADGSPADSAGLEEDDVILTVNGVDIEDASDLVNKIREMKPGDLATLVVQRDGTEKTIGVILGERNDDPLAFAHKACAWAPKMAKALSKSMDFMAPRKPVLGVKIQTLEPQLGEFFKAPNGKGVLVTEVMDVDDSPAQQAGIKAGDVIVKINAESVEDNHDVFSALEGLKKGDKLSIDLIRNGARKTLSATLKEDVPESGSRGMMQWHGKAPMSGHFDSDEFDDDEKVRRLQLTIPRLDLNEQDINIDAEEMKDATRKLRVKVKKIIDGMELDKATMDRIREEMKSHRGELKREVKTLIDKVIQVKHI